MKALKNLDNTGKAMLLHELFPDEIPALLDHLKQVCADFQTYKDTYAKQWDSGFMTFDYWLGLSQQTAAVINKFSFNMTGSSKVFSDQLCDGCLALFVNDRIIKYSDKVSTNEKFKLAVELLYK